MSNVRSDEVFKLSPVAQAEIERYSSPEGDGDRDRPLAERQEAETRDQPGDVSRGQDAEGLSEKITASGDISEYS